MPQITDIIHTINEEIITKAVSLAITSYIKENPDLFEELIERVVERIEGNASMLDNLALAVSQNFLTMLQESGFELSSIDPLEDLAKSLYEKSLSKIKAVLEEV